MSIKPWDTAKAAEIFDGTDIEFRHEGEGRFFLVHRLNGIRVGVAKELSEGGVEAVVRVALKFQANIQRAAGARDEAERIKKLF